MVEQVGGKHYFTGEGQIQHWDIVPGQAAYLLGCASKYASRHRSKLGREDVEKGISYLKKLRDTRSIVDTGDVLWETVRSWAQNVPKLSYLDYTALEKMFTGKYEQAISIMQRILEEDYPEKTDSDIHVNLSASVDVSEVEEFIDSLNTSRYYGPMQLLPSTFDAPKIEIPTGKVANIVITDAPIPRGRARTTDPVVTVTAPEARSDDTESLRMMTERRVPRYDLEKETRERYRVGEIEKETIVIERSRPGTPEDGGHHASVTPWEVDCDWRDNFLVQQDEGTIRRDLFNLFWKIAATNLFRLEAVVRSHTMPKELAMCYDWHAPDIWSLTIRHVPEQLRDCYPRLQREMNLKEYDISIQDFKFMYFLNGNEKYVLRDEFTLWGRE